MLIAATLNARAHVRQRRLDVMPGTDCDDRQAMAQVVVEAHSLFRIAPEKRHTLAWTLAGAVRTDAEAC